MRYRALPGQRLAAGVRHRCLRTPMRGVARRLEYYVSGSADWTLGWRCDRGGTCSPTVPPTPRPSPPHEADAALCSIRCAPYSTSVGECGCLRSKVPCTNGDRDKSVFERSTTCRMISSQFNPGLIGKVLWQLPDGSYRIDFSIGENEISGHSAASRSAKPPRSQSSRDEQCPVGIIALQACGALCLRIKTIVNMENNSLSHIPAQSKIAIYNTFTAKHAENDIIP